MHTVFENIPKMSHLNYCSQILQKKIKSSLLIFEFWHYFQNCTLWVIFKYFPPLFRRDRRRERVQRWHYLIAQFLEEKSKRISAFSSGWTSLAREAFTSKQVFWSLTDFFHFRAFFTSCSASRRPKPKAVENLWPTPLVIHWASISSMMSRLLERTIRCCMSLQVKRGLAWRTRAIKEE